MGNWARRSRIRDLGARPPERGSAAPGVDAKSQRDFRIVADTGLVAALPLCLSAGPKQKSLTVADRAATRPVVRGSSSAADFT